MNTILKSAVPTGYQQLTVDNTSGGVALTVPISSNVAVIKSETAQARWRDDATNPSTTVGMPFDIGDILVLNDALSLSQFKAIRTGATSAVFNISYYKI